MVRRMEEDGNATVQFLIAAMFMFVLVFGGIQIGGMMLSANALASDLARASYQVDAGGLALAADKDAFVRDQIIAAGSTLKESALPVTGVRISTSHSEATGGVREDSQGLTEIASDTARIEVSFDVAYEMPSIIDMPGLTGQVLARHVEFVRIGERTIEVR